MSLSGLVADTNAHIPSGARFIIFDLSLYLHPGFVYASIEGSGEALQLRWLA